MQLIEKMALTYDDVCIVPQYSNIKSRTLIDISTNITKNIKIRTPIVASPMDTVVGEDMMFEMWRLGGVGFLHRFYPIEKQLDIIKSVRYRIENEFDFLDVDDSEDVVLGASIGVKDQDIVNAELLLKAGIKIILIDVAHGHCEMMKQTLLKLTELKKNYVFDIIAGNVATRSATRDLIEWGADGIRVGISGGSTCSTRIKTGSGVPMISSIQDCVDVADEYGVPVMGDGGIRYEGDVAKAIGSGASCVMLGSLLAGTDESPGELINASYTLNSGKVKVYRGSASMESKIVRGENTNIEGVSRMIPYKGSVESVINSITDGLRSAMSYTGVDNINDMREKCILRVVTNNGLIEGTPHLK